ncbi:MAG TPA: SufD family Fe-S cluster assembly protein [Candidatus Agathobaculum pullistercoris]|nr:SufD family Fe-S cluster assembly protein [uncultured Agathobaculum sp.]HIX11424.1 SufD family Fe-S cluster assembly protein [Candidatus Agathobaculum pullistercoris]
MNKITERLLKAVSGWTGVPQNAAYNIREDGLCAGRQSTKNIQITSKTDKPGIDVTILPDTKGETVYIPACVTHSAIDDLVYNDFYIGENADVTIVAGCGVHSDGEEEARHNGIHRFVLGKNAHVLYLEKHLGTGTGAGARKIDPVTEVEQAEGSVMEMETTQIGGVDSTHRTMSAKLTANAKLRVRERLLTDGSQQAFTDFNVSLDGDGSGCDLISRSVAKEQSHQEFRSVIHGNRPCTGHSECDAIIMGHGTVNASPALAANHEDAALIHEAAIGKIAGEQILKLCTLGLTEEEAEAKIVEGFLR